MGTEQSKSRKSTCRRSTYQIVNGKIHFANGDKYSGDFKDGELNGNGTYHYSNGDTYKGEWRRNKKQGYGIQIYTGENKKYVGHWQDNLSHGEGTIYYPDGSYFTGIFLEGEKHGKGVFHDNQNDDYEEEWVNGELQRREPLSPFKKHDKPSISNFPRRRELKDNSDEKSPGQEEEEEDDFERRASPKSEGNIIESEEVTNSDKKNYDTRITEREFDDKQFHSNILFKSQNEYDSGAYEVGLDTLNVIEHMEMLNSVAGILLNKDVSEWTYKDVGDWLKHLGLNDYIEKFQQNHIDGKVLFDITETDLKDEFNMNSVGHRKNFMKAVENLKRIYNQKDGKNSDYVRNKIQKFYEKNKQNSKSLLAGLTKERRFYSHRYSTRNIYSSQHEVIEEDEEFNLKNDAHPSPQIAPRSFLEQKDEVKFENNTKIASPRKKGECETGDADDESRGRNSMEDPAEPNSFDLQTKPYLSKKKLSKISAESQKNSPEMKGQDLLEQNEVDMVEESNKKASPPHSRKESSGSQGSSSDTSSESDSDEEKVHKGHEEKINNKEENLPTNPPLKVARANSKFEKKATKKNIGEKAGNFKSVELPAVSRTALNKYTKKPKPNKNTANDKDALNEKIKDEILRIFKVSGLNENFIIDYNEITFEKKIGEGGYGRVFLGRFSGIDVAIKEYGKTKLDIKRAEDFVKEIEVISNLRHPNIVLCMGACIHNGKYLMITEYLEEGSLFDHLHKKHTKINDETMFNIIEDIALGMCYLHGRKIFHCDLKSSNILIDSSWSVKLCDFGLSRVKYKSDRKRFQKQRVGTPHWMAPEILRGEKYDECADVYSFGMILWELLTGEIPYYQTPISEIIATVGYEGKRVSVPTKGNSIILSIMKNCLNLDKHQRPTFKQIVDQLQQRNKNLMLVAKKTKTWI